MKEDKIQKEFVQKPIRTFENDIAEALGKGASMATIAIAEQKRKDEERKKKQLEEEREKTPEEKLDEAEKLAEKATDNLQAEIENISGTNKQSPIPQTIQETQNKQSQNQTSTNNYKKPPLPINPAPDMVRSSPIVDIAPNVERDNIAIANANIPVPIPPAPQKEKPVITEKPKTFITPNIIVNPPPKSEPVPVQMPVIPPKPIAKIENKPIIKPIPRTEPKIVNNIKENIIEEDINESEKRNIIKPLLKVLLIMLFIGGGIYGAYYVYENNLLSKTVPVEQKIIVPSIVSPNKQMTWNIDNINKTQLISQIYSQLKKNSQTSGKVLELILTEKVGEPDKQKDIAISGSTFIEKSGVSMPDVLKRSLTDKWMLGSYTEENDQITPFIILTTDFFQNTFAGMLSWDDNMPEDLSTLLNYREKAINIDNIASSSTLSYFNIRGNFIDKQIMNRDLREFRASNGELLFLYSFISKNSLIITTTESAFIDIIKRIEKQTYIR